MTNYPQQPQFNAPQVPQETFGDSPLTDPTVRMILSMSPQDGSLRPLPADLQFQESADGTMNVTYPDGSIRQLIPGAEGEGRMITTLADGTRIQSDLTFGEGQVSVSSISSTGEKTLLSLNENGANMQRVTADGQVFSFIPDSAPELIESFREAEAFAQEKDFQSQEDFQSNQQYGEWNNYGKPADWQPEQNWQPPQGDFMPPQNFGPQFGGDNFGRPDYAGNNWVDNGNGSWIAPIQPDAFPQPQQYGEWNNYGKPADWQPQQNWQPPQGNYIQPQNFGAQFGGPEFGGPQPMPFAPMPPQNFGGNDFGRPDYAGNNWVDNGNGSWIAPIQPNAFQQPQQNWQPPQSDYIQPQNFGPQFGGPEFGGPQPMPFAPMPPQNFGGNDFGRPDYAGNNWVDNGNGSWIAPVQNWQPPQPSDASGFFKPNPTDGSGFPFAPEANAPSFDGSSPIVEIVTSFDEAPNDEWNNPEQAPQQ